MAFVSEWTMGVERIDTAQPEINEVSRVQLKPYSDKINFLNDI